MTDPEDPGASAEGGGSVDPFVTEYELLRRRLRLEPDLFTQVAAIPGCESLVEALQQDDIGQELTCRLWDVLLADDANSRALMHFLWVATLPCKKRFVKGLERYLSDPYPMFAGLSRKWPGGNSIPPYVRDAAERVGDFGLVDQGYLGYLKAGYTEREVELLVWLEALRDRQCSDRPCQVGRRAAGLGYGRGGESDSGGCPLQVHIPEVLALVGRGCFQEAFELVESCHPLPDLTGLACPQDEYCRGACIYGAPIPIGQVEAFLPARARLRESQGASGRERPPADPWVEARRPPIAVVGSGPSGLVMAYLLATQGYPVAIFEALPDFGGSLRYRVPEFRLPRRLIDDVVGRITGWGVRFVPDFVVGGSASVQDLQEAGFWKVFLSHPSVRPELPELSGDRLPGVLGADEFLLRTNLVGRGGPGSWEGSDLSGKKVVVVGDGGTMWDVARTVRRLGGEATVVREELHRVPQAWDTELRYAQEEGVGLRTEARVTGFVQGTDGSVVGVEVVASGSETEEQVIPTDLVVVASRDDTIPDAAAAVGAALATVGDLTGVAADLVDDIADRVARAGAFTDVARSPHRVVGRRALAGGFVEMELTAPLVAEAAGPGQFVRVQVAEGQFIPLCLADWGVRRGTITVVVHRGADGEGELAELRVGDVLAGVAGPLGKVSRFVSRAGVGGVLFVVAGGGAPRVHALVRACLRAGRRAHLVVSSEEGETAWTDPGGPFDLLRQEFPELLCAWPCGGVAGASRRATVDSLLCGDEPVAAVVVAGPSFFLRSVAEQCRSRGVACSVVVNSTVVDATGSCGACLVPLSQEGQPAWRRACIDGLEMDGHLIDWDRYLLRCPRG
ncbi:NAD(P)-binding protein [Austwickia chelonae]|uniref:NAD(P)-binding protein n=1 Tax=Austwickia chelonae TaxID=100225 RepID=UPI000E23BE7A|nr:NAD(P)-binding protein [Austwickia chelonae]